MKTLHTISAVITLSISTFSHAENNQPQNENTLTISVLEIKQPTCNGASNGSISVEVKGGKLPYIYDWNTFPAQSTQTANNLTKGIYFIQVTDADGLVSYKSIEVTDPIHTLVNPVSISSVVSQSVTVITENEDDVFVYYLNGEQIAEPIISGLDIGIHKLEITNQSNCTVVQFIQIIEVESGNSENENNNTVIETTPLIILENNLEMAPTILVQNE